MREMVICLYIFLLFIELQLKYEKGLEWKSVVILVGIYLYASTIEYEIFN